MTQLHPILFVGAGPGDPDLITVKGRRALEEADTVIYAGSLVPEALLKWTREGTRSVSSAGMHLTEIVAEMATDQQAGKRVVRLHTGDPSLYGAIAEQMALLDDRGIPYAVIPGVTAAFAAAAASCMEYTVPEQTQTLILTRAAGRTPVPDAENLRALASHGSSMAIYLSAALAEKVSEALAEGYGPDAPCLVAVRVSHPEERFVRATVSTLAQTMKEEGIDRLALIIVGPAVAATGEARSKLYDRTFAHGYRADDAGGR